MSFPFIDELNRANQERRGSLPNKIREMADDLIEYIKNQMMRRVNEGNGHIKKLTATADVNFGADAMGTFPVLPYEIYHSTQSSDERKTLSKEYYDICKKTGEGLIFQFHSRDEFDSFSISAGNAAVKLGIEDISIELDEAEQTAVMEFTVYLD